MMCCHLGIVYEPDSSDDTDAAGVYSDSSSSSSSSSSTNNNGSFCSTSKSSMGSSDSGQYKFSVVAVKRLRQEKFASVGTERDLLREAMVLAQVAGHTNVASLLGVVTSGTPTLLVLKYCSNGTLLNLLHFRHANGPELTLDERVGDNYAPFYCLALPSICLCLVNSSL